MFDSTGTNKGLPYVLFGIVRRVYGALVAIASLYAVLFIFGIQVNEAYHALIIIAALLAILILPSSYRRLEGIHPNIWNLSLPIIGRWCLFVGILLLLGYATKTSSVFSRRAMFTWFLVTPPLIVLAQIAIDLLMSRLLLSSTIIKRVVIAGAGELGQQLASRIRSSRLTSLKVDGFFDDRCMDRLASDTSLSLLGGLQDLPDYVRKHGADVIFVALPLRTVRRVTDLLDQLHDTTASIYFVPDVFVFDLIQCSTSEIEGMPVVALCETPFQGTSGLIKTATDYIFASLMLLLVSPLMIAIAITIKITSPGTVIFKQRRYGLDGREFVCYKFRTMTVSEDSGQIKQATRDDKRVTKLGAILRKSSLDELPQLINVLQGRMSIVGPRPHAVAHNEEYRSLIKGYMVRHKVKPGITGLAQVMGYRGETATVDAMKKRVECDLDYLRNWSFGLDVRIIIKTVLVVFKDKMAF